MSMDPLHVLFGKVSSQVFCQFLNCIVCLSGLSCIHSLYILEIKPLSDVSLVKMLSHTVGSLLVLLQEYFHCMLIPADI